MKMFYQQSYKTCPAICLKCAEVFNPGKNIVLKCPSCGFEIKTGQYEEIFRYSFYAARYGYQYRKIFEQRKGNLDDAPHYTLAAPNDLIIFVAIAAITGIIGNVSYDLIKIAIQKIFEKYRNQNNQEQTIEIDLNFDEFIDLMSSYYNNYEGIDGDVYEEIFGEMMADTSADNPKIASKMVETGFKRYRTKKDKKRIKKLYMRIGNKLIENTLRKPDINKNMSFWENL